MSTSLSEQVVRSQFTTPAALSGAVILQLQVPKGTPVAWLPALGRYDMRDQAELLFLGDIQIDIIEVNTGIKTPIVKGRVR